MQSLTRWQGRVCIRLLICSLGITKFGLRLATSLKQPLLRVGVSSNLWSCLSGSVMLQRRFNAS